MSETQPARRRFALEVVKQLRAAGFEALWAGGCVRDLLLEREPQDFDVATSARPEQVRQLFGMRRTLAVGAAFGVIIVLGSNPAAGQVEVATFRNDAQYSDGRRPDSVTFSTAEEDAARRDFTINGMFYDPLTEQVIDYVGGEADLARSLIRAIGDADLRIGEDKLRMLRAIRFAARFNFAIEAATEAAIARHAAELSVVSGERMNAEMHKTLITPGREMAVRTWAETGLMEILLPELASQWDNVRERVSSLLRAVDPNPWTAALTVCLWPLQEACADPQSLHAIVDHLRLRLKFSNEEIDQVKFALTAQPTLSRSSDLRWSALQPYLIQPHIHVAMEVLRARVACGEVERSQVEYIQHKLSLPAEELNPLPLVDGRVLQSLGLVPGPRFKELLNQVRVKQLDGQLLDQAAAIAWIREQTCRP